MVGFCREGSSGRAVIGWYGAHPGGEVERKVVYEYIRLLGGRCGIYAVRRFVPTVPPCIREPGCFSRVRCFFFRVLSLFASAAWMMCFFLQRSVAAVKQAAPARRELLLVIFSPEAMGDGPGATGRLAGSSSHLERKT